MRKRRRADNPRIEDLLTLPQAAKLLGVTRQALYLRMKRNTIRFERIGSAIFLYAKDVQEELDGKP